jgi:hypothetical protein
MTDPDGYQPDDATAAFVVTHTSGDEVVTDGYPTLADAEARAAEVYRQGDFPVTIDSTADDRHWAYDDDGTLQGG